MINICYVVYFDRGSDCCKHTIALMLTLSSINKSNNYETEKVNLI